MSNFEEQFRSFAQALLGAAIHVSSNRPTLAALEADHRQLVNELAALDKIQCLGLVAALLTLPQFHANTLRLEILQLLIHKNAVGQNLPSYIGLDRWLNKRLRKGHEKLEDPVEDVFVSNVICKWGNCRVFEGIWEANDFWLQQALDVLNHLRHKNEDAAALLNECESLLALSEEVAERCGLARFCMGGGSPQSSINIPSIESLRGRSKFVFFTPMQLAKMGISLGELAPFIHPAGVLSDEPDTHSLELYPIVQAGENLLLALPAAISPAIRSHVINTAKAKEFGEEFRQVLVELEKAILIRDFGPRMGGTQMSFQSPDPTQTEAGICYQLLFRFDLDKLALVILFSASYSKVLDAGLAGIQEQTDSEREALTDHLFQTVEAIETQYKVSSGVVLAVFGGLGRARAMSFKRFPRHWHLCGSGIHNFVTLSKVKDMSFLMLWKLQSQERALEEMGINISNANGIVNLVGYWEHFGGRLVPVQQDLGSRAQLMVGCDFIAAVRQRVRTTHNVHAVRRSSSATWRVVSRLNIDPYFTSEADEPIFVDYDATRIGELYGLMEGDKQQYWLIHDQAHKALWQRDFARRVWDSLLSWTRQLGPIIEAILPSLPTGPLEIIIEFDRLSDWNKPTIEAIPTGSNDIEVHVCAEFNQIKLVIPVELVRDFATPQNVAERALLRSMLCGLCHLAKRSISPRKLDDLVNRVVKE